MQLEVMQLDLAAGIRAQRKQFHLPLDDVRAVERAIRGQLALALP
jgi:hypothetical protein